MTKHILKVKIIGLCSKHRNNKESKKYINGAIVKDKDLHCIACELGKTNLK